MMLTPGILSRVIVSGTMLKPILLAAWVAGMAVQDETEVFSDVANMSVEIWNSSIARNLTTAFLLTRAVLPGMQHRRYGRIVHMSSTTGTRVSNPGKAAYAAAKAGIVGMSMSLALEVAPFGITVNSVASGWIATQSSTAEELTAARYVPVGRAGRPEEVAAAVAFLSDTWRSRSAGIGVFKTFQLPFQLHSKCPPPIPYHCILTAHLDVSKKLEPLLDTLA